MTIARTHFIQAVSLMVLTIALVGCGGGGGGSGVTLQPPAYNVTGFWTITETRTSHNCPTTPPLSLNWNANATQATGSNTVYVKDTRAGASDPAAAMTMSGNSLTFSGDRYNEAPADCDSMTASYSLTLSSATAFTGSGTVVCHWTGGSCSIGTSLSGHQ